MENIHDHISFCNCCITHIPDEIMSRYTYLRVNDELIVGHRFISLSFELDIFIIHAILYQKKTLVKRNQNKMCSFTPIDLICCLLQWVAPIHPMKYAYGSWFVVFCCAWVRENLSISPRVTSLVPQPSHDCLSASNANSWWRHQIETFSALLALCAGNSPDAGEFPPQRPVTRSFDVFFDLRLNKQLSKQS